MLFDLEHHPSSVTVLSCPTVRSSSWQRTCSRSKPAKGTKRGCWTRLLHPALPRKWL